MHFSRIYTPYFKDHNVKLKELSLKVYEYAIFLYQFYIKYENIVFD